ncbi:MAG TPA: GGDEF domain-containing protein [Pseudomonadota bacterium]|nr:GGDEF domain-containing protein [Pseudomonadota bacterium]
MRRIERTSRLDPLTGLGSGDWLHAERWPAALRSGRPLGVLYLDLDHLKLRNDRFGHAVGDVYIRTAAAELARALRRGVDEVFRLHTAGDEFIALLHGPISDVESFGHSLLRRLRSRGITASVGLAYSTRTDHVPERVNLRNLAEASCREAKQRGGDCLVIGLGLDDRGDVSTGLIVDGDQAPSLQDAARSGSAAEEAIPEPIEDEPTPLAGPAQRARHGGAVEESCPLEQGVQ